MGGQVDGKWSAGAVVRAKSQRLAQVGGVFFAVDGDGVAKNKKRWAVGI